MIHLNPEAMMPIDDVEMEMTPENLHREVEFALDEQRQIVAELESEILNIEDESEERLNPEERARLLAKYKNQLEEEQKMLECFESELPLL